MPVIEVWSQIKSLLLNFLELKSNIKSLVSEYIQRSQLLRFNLYWSDFVLVYLFTWVKDVFHVA